MTPWLDKSGFPVITVTQEGKELAVTQGHFLLDQSKVDASRLWPVPLLADSSKVPALLDKKELHVTLSSDDYVHINSGAVGHYIVHYTEPEHNAALAAKAADKTLSVTERIMLLNDNSMLARAGLSSYDVTLGLLQHFANEDSEPVWGIMGMVLGEVRRFIDSDTALEAPMKESMRTLVQKQYDRLGWEPKANETPQDTKLRADILGLGVYAEHPTITKRALELFDAYIKNSSKVSADIRGVVFGSAVRGHHPGAFEYLLQLLETTTDPSLKSDILGSLTVTKREDETAILLARLKDGEKVRQQDVDHWLVFLLRNRYSRQLAWSWMQDEWPWLQETFSKDPSYDYLPRYAASAFNTRTLLQEYKQFFEPKTDQLMLAHNIKMGIEELESRVAWLERDLASVQAFYKR
jgi:aminopeptidase N